MRSRRASALEVQLPKLRRLLDRHLETVRAALEGARDRRPGVGARVDAKGGKDGHLGVRIWVGLGGRRVDDMREQVGGGQVVEAAHLRG